ncbi:rhodanese-like domain-containing protein [Pelagerythrobacter marensis]|uniref:Putative Rhodanese-like protein n=1 Tax=Pelagerythrobacter marensis TaxID=543877 RepID=A0A0G3XC20_9SPHN|nr:rhodanese-like domain-containing protein [Pelagerythrobacter marensis]AKM08732.1 Putative Rhodanese-like protein [Pelagerythrobacter marensis]
MKFLYPISLLAAACLSAPALAQQGNPQIDYDGFAALTMELAETRTRHLIDLATFETMLARGDAVLLDTRSAAAFELGHIAGAINLPFSDFTDAKLAAVLGEDKGRAILIYCNNNFSDNLEPVVSKRAPLALNIPTFINLHGYGYTNVWELAEVVATADVDWVAAAPEPARGG